MIAAPLAMLIAIRPLLAEPLPRRRAENLTPGGRNRPVGAAAGGAAGRLGGPGHRLRRRRLYSSFLALREAPVGPPGHGAELRAFLPIVHGQPVLYAGQDRYAAYELLGADTHVPLVEFPDEDVTPEPREAVRHRRRLQPDRLRLLLPPHARTASPT